MGVPPIFEIDLNSFWSDPYPALAAMRERTPIAFVPQLNAILLTKRDDIFVCEKNIDVFSSLQPGGLMTTLMGENMMRKDGAAHQAERKQIFPALSPTTVRDVWRHRFEKYTNEILDSLTNIDNVDLVRDYAMPVSANALREITGLTSMTPAEMDAVSQAMIDGCANYAGDTEIEQRCHAATKRIDDAIAEHWATQDDPSDISILNVLKLAGQALPSIRANIKLVISGGQNEPRDAIAGVACALLTHPQQLAAVRNGKAKWTQAFEEYARWISPIGMSPRRIARDFVFNDIEFKVGDRVFLMFGSANRDETIFEEAQSFDITRDASKAIAFGAGPHFCAGAAASRSMIAEVALPLLFERYADLKLDGEVPFGGWAFRGPLSMPVALGNSA